MAQELAGRGLGDDRSLVADDGVVDPCLRRVATHRLEHAARHDDDVHAGCAGGPDGGDRARPQDRVLRDQRAVEVAGERLDVGREAGGERQLFWVRKATRSATCWSLRLANDGITPSGKPGTT